MNVKLVCSLIVMILVTSLAVNVYFYIKTGSLEDNVAEYRLYRMKEYAWDAVSRLASFEGWYYRCAYDLEYYMSQDLSNETKDYIVQCTVYLLMRYSEEASAHIDESLRSLGWIDTGNRETYNKIFETVSYALSQVQWTITLRKNANETYNLLWELYYILGIDQITRSENLTDLRGIEYSLRLLWIYWDSEYSLIFTHGKSQMPTNLIKPETALEWALGNATALYQKLQEWHQRTWPTW